MVDLHSHILPMLDDGSASFRETIAMFEIASKWDIKHIVATSHGNIDEYPYTLDQYKEAFTRLQVEIRRRNIGIKIYPGMEIMLDGNEIQRLQAGELLTINNTDYVLVEVPFGVSHSFIMERITALKEAGYRVVLAHPERYDAYKRKPERIEELTDIGCALQINTGSISGVFGRECQRTATQLLDMGLVHIIATDTHDTRLRSHNMREVISVLNSRYSAEKIHLWISENPSRVLKGMDILTSIHI